MKKSRIFLALAGACAIFFAGCSDVGSDSTVSNGFENKTNETKSLKLNVNSDNDLLIFPTASSGSGRTILPAAVDASDNTAVKFYLAYTDTLAASPSEKFETTALDLETGATATSGVINKTFEISVYNFTLYCVPASASVTNATTAKNNAMFVGYASADLRYSEEITFYLTAANAIGSGNVNLNLYTSNDGSTTEDDLWEVPKGYSVTAGIYSLVDDSLVFPTGGTAAPLTTPTPVTAATKINNKTFGGTSATVTAGEYNFIVRFTNESAIPNKVYEYSDRIIILPNQKTTGDVFIPNVLESAPKTPTDFIAAYADPKSKSDTDYFVQFAWNDASNNEQGFEIQLIDVSDNADNTQGTPTYNTSILPTDDDTWGPMLTAYGKGDADIVTYYSNTPPSDPTIVGPKIKYRDSDRNPNSEVYSLIKNNTTACFYLPLGKRYLARMRAVNEVGPSDWAYITLTDLVGDSTPATKYTHTTGAGGSATSSEIAVANGNLGITMKAFAANTQTINRYRITYNLDGGEFKGEYANATGYGTLANKPATVVYATQTVSASAPVGEALLNPDGNSAKTKYIDTTGDEQEEIVNLIKSESKFKRWLLTSNIDGGDFAPIANRYPTKANAALRDVPDAYTGHTNLVLFANYAVDTSMNINIADYTAYNWADADVNLSGTGIGNTDCRNGEYMEISAKANPSITFKLNTTTKEYDEVTLVIRRTNRPTDADADLTKVWTTPTATYSSGAWSASPAAWDVPVKTWKSGVYQATLIGTSSKYPNKTYSFTITFNLVD